MTDVLGARVEPTPTPEEAAAIVAALEALRGGPEAATAPEDSPSASAGRSRWRLAGLLGYPPREMETEDSLWAYTRWEDIP
jgi:hypothetical protein